MKNKYCGNCKHFTNEDVNGYGWCSSLLARTRCDSGICREYEEPNNGWTKITPETMNDITEELMDRTLVGFIFDGSLVYMPCPSCKDRLSSFALMGSYYYYILPELKIE